MRRFARKHGLYDQLAALAALEATGDYQQLAAKKRKPKLDWAQWYLKVAGELEPRKQQDGPIQDDLTDEKALWMAERLIGLEAEYERNRSKAVPELEQAEGKEETGG